MERRCYRYTDGEAIDECSELLLRSQTAENSKRLMKTVYRKMVERLSLSLSPSFSRSLSLSVPIYLDYTLDLSARAQP